MMQNIITGKLKLFKTIKIDGKEVKELEYNFETMPSNAIARATTFLAQNRYAVNNPMMDVELHNLLFGLAAGIALEEAYTLHPKDRMAAAGQSASFFNEDLGDSSVVTISAE